MNPYQQPDLFDLPGDRRRRRIFLAWGQKIVKGAKGRKARKTMTQWVNAPTPEIARRTGGRFLSKLGYRLCDCREHTWEEYAADFRGITGVTVSFRPAPLP